MDNPSSPVANNEVVDVDCSAASTFEHDDHRASSPDLFIGPLANPEMAVQSRYEPTDVKGATSMQGSCGLYNLGNTCFMNSGIQCLTSSAPLLKFFFEEFQLDETLHGTLTGAFYLLLCKIWSGKYSIIHPRHFKELLGLYHPQFQDYRQHDCQEFLALLLDTFHEQLNRTSSSSNTHTSAITQSQSHMNNEDLLEPAAAGTENTDTAEPVARADTAASLLCSETLSGEEEPVSSRGPEMFLRSSQGQSSNTEGSQGSRGSLKRQSSSSPVVAVLASEDSNHSTVSAHSTDSEQSSAFKRLKIELDAAASPGHLSSVSESCDGEQDSEKPGISASTGSGGSGGASLAAAAAAAPRRKKSRDENECSEELCMDTCAPSTKGLKAKKGIRLTIPVQSQGPELKAVQKGAEAGEKSVDTEAFNNQDRPQCSGGAAASETTVITTPTPLTPTLQNDLPMASSPNDYTANPLHFYCKETKTLNTNVLVSNFVQGDVAMDSEKFLKVDNRNQLPGSKEVNLLQEALIGMEEDKVDKALIRKSLSSGSSTVSTSDSRDTKGHNSCNLRSVKSLAHGGGSMLRKSTVDPNLLNNSYDLEDEMLVGYSGLVGKPLQKRAESVGVMEKAKQDLHAVARVAKMELAPELVSSEVEKNVQMQALSKLKASMAKSNIREDISDKASTSESTETEDGEMEAEGESSATEDDDEEPPSRDSVGGEEAPLADRVNVFTPADVVAANEAWEKYKERNSSIVVDTFQGQFKSTVVCSECDHVSVTYEPFMYLSLPIPFAMERQICVVFIRPHKSIVRYMVTMHKNDKVERLRRQLQAMTDTEGSDVVLAEVLDNHVSRILDDNIMLRYVNDTNRTIHAYQMLPPPDIPQEQILSVCAEESGHFHLNNIPPSPNHFPSTSPICHHTDGISMSANTDLSRPLTIDIGEGPQKMSRTLLDMEQVTAMLRARRPTSPLVGGSSAAIDQSDLGRDWSLDPAGDWKGERGELTMEDLDEVPAPMPEDGGVDPMLMGTPMWEWTSRGGSEDVVSNPSAFVSAPPTSPTCEGETLSFPPDLNADYQSEAMFPQSPSSMDVEMDHIPSTSQFGSQIWPDADDLESGVRGGGGDAGVGNVGAIDQWQTCAICLEELLATQLLTHQTCSGVFCHNCLEMSAKHSGELANSCPVCLSPVDVTQDFVPLASGATIKCKIRIRAVPITFRTRAVSGGLSGGAENGETASGQELHLVCSPRLTYVASQQDASSLYEQVDRVVPFTATYSLHFTDWQGVRCSRCEFSDHCTGCEVSKEGEIMLQPDDNLTVHFMEELLREEVEDKTHITDDASLDKLRSTDPISIFDCFEAFTQSEVLDEHNPWYCPCCRQNQCAKKTMTVWRYPDNLIIHLKRFVYEDLASTKIDNRVVFPHTNLDVTRFLAGPSTSFNIYDLYSIVCHYGGANSGHYTAFSCHPLTNEWYNYNDENVSQQSPGDSEYDSGYVLFFKRQGPPVTFDLTKDVLKVVEEEVAPSVSFEPLDEHTTTAIVTFETDGFSVVSDNVGESGGEKNGNYDFYN